MATSDILGYLFQSDGTSGSANLKFDGTMTELLAFIYPYIYRNFITTGYKSCKIMYDENLKALYGTLETALLFWLKISTDLKKRVLNMNRYNWCVMNKDIEGE